MQPTMPPAPSGRTAKEIIEQAIRDNRRECVLYAFTIPLFAMPFIACAALGLWFVAGAVTVTIAVFALILASTIPSVVLAFRTLHENSKLRALETAFIDKADPEAALRDFMNRGD